MHSRPSTHDAPSAYAPPQSHHNNNSNATSISSGVAVAAAAAAHQQQKRLLGQQQQQQNRLIIEQQQQQFQQQLNALFVTGPPPPSPFGLAPPIAHSSSTSSSDSSRNQQSPFHQNQNHSSRSNATPPALFLTPGSTAAAAGQNSSSTGLVSHPMQNGAAAAAAAAAYTASLANIERFAQLGRFNQNNKRGHGTTAEHVENDFSLSNRFGVTNSNNQNSNAYHPSPSTTPTLLLNNNSNSSTRRRPSLLPPEKNFSLGDPLVVVSSSSGTCPPRSTSYDHHRNNAVVVDNKYDLLLRNHQQLYPSSGSSNSTTTTTSTYDHHSRKAGNNSTGKTVIVTSASVISSIGGGGASSNSGPVPQQQQHPAALSSSMPSMTVSSSLAAASAPINHHHHQHHHQQQQQHHQQPVPPSHSNNPLTLIHHHQQQQQPTGLTTTTGSGATLHHHAAVVSSGSVLPPTVSSAAAAAAAAASIHHQQHHAGPTLTSLPPHNHLSHGHLLNEFYDISNKRPRLSNHPGQQQHHYAGVSGGGSSAGLSQLPPGVLPPPPPGALVGMPTTSSLISNIHNGLVAALHASMQQQQQLPYHPNQYLSANNSLVANPLHQQQQQQPPQQHAKSGSGHHGHHPSLSASLVAAAAAARQQTPSLNQELIETIEDNVEDGYNPHFEAISPTPQDESRVSPLTSLKDQILLSIKVCDREISTVEARINVLRIKAHQLEAATRKPPTDPEEEVKSNGTKEPTLVQKIYEENAMKATKSHQQFCIVGSLNLLPLYNGPSDLKITHQNHQNFLRFRSRLIERLRKRNEEGKARQRATCEQYDKNMREWLKKLEKIESNPTKKARDSKVREYFEKQFPELKKQREDRERLQRGAQRIRSEADIEEIVDGLQVQELEDKKMRSYAVIPPIMYDEEERRRHVRFENRNGFLADPMALHKELKLINIWTEGERAIFREKYLMHPKKFGIIAQSLERKSIADCIQNYYLTKKHENYKQLLRKHVKKRTRAMIRAQQQQNLVNSAGQQNRGSPSIRAPNGNGVSTGSDVTRIAVKPYPPSATSVILPYSLPQASSTSTVVTFTMPSLASGTDSAALKSNTQTATVNGPNLTTTIVSVTSATGTTTASSSATVSNGSIAGAITTTTMSSSSGTPSTITAGTAPTAAIKCDNNVDNNSSNNNTTCDTNGAMICCVCGEEISSQNHGKSRPVYQNNLTLYGLTLSTLKSVPGGAGASAPDTVLGRVCLRCHQKNVQRHCPIPSCLSSKRKVKRLKTLPQQWIDMTPIEVKQRYADELNIPLDAKIGCARCVMRIGRRIGLVTNHKSTAAAALAASATSNKTGTSSPATLLGLGISKEDVRKLWLDPDVEKLRSLIKLHGKDWPAISAAFDSQPNRTPQDCYKVFVLFKQEFNLTAALKAYNQSTGRHGAESDTDGDDVFSVAGDSDDTSSGLEDVANSDTASASSSVAGKPDNETMAAGVNVSGNNGEKSNLQDFKPLSLSQGSLKSDYDSSATMSADESSNANDGVDRSGSFSFPSGAAVNHNVKVEAKADDVKPAMTPPTSTATNLLYSGLYSNRDKQLGFDAPQVPTFLINPNAPSAQIVQNTPVLPLHHHSNLVTDRISNSESAPSSTVTGSGSVTCVTAAAAAAGGGGSSGTCVRDLIYKAIEKSLQSEGKPAPSTITSAAPVAEPPRTESTPSHNSPHPLCLKREVPTPTATPQPTDLSKLDLLTMKKPFPSGSGDPHKPEGLAMMGGYSYLQQQRPPSVHPPEQPDVCEVQDLSNKSKDRSRLVVDYQSTINAAQQHRHSPKVKMDSARSSPSISSKSPFSQPAQLPPPPPLTPQSQQQYVPYGIGGLPPAHSNPASRLSNMIDTFIHHDAKGRPPPQPSPYSVPPPPAPSPLKTNSKSAPAFSISPKTETAIRDKLGVPPPPTAGGGGSITQGTPVVLQQQLPAPSVLPPNPPQSHTPSAIQQQQQAAALAAFNAKFGPTHPPFYHPDMFRQITEGLAKGSITQGTPLIIGGNPPPTLPLIATSTPTSMPHHYQLNPSSSRNASGKSNVPPEAMDFALLGGHSNSKRSRYSDPKSSLPFDLMERLPKSSFEHQQQQQHSLYHRPFSPNYSKPVPPPPPSAPQANSGKDSHVNQILIDFNTSKQMQPRRSSGSSSEKETPASHPERLIAPPGTLDKHHRSGSFPSPAPSPSSNIYLQERAAHEKIVDPALLQWQSPFTYEQLANSPFLNRQNVIQLGYPPVSKASVIQAPQSNSPARDFRDVVLVDGSGNPLKNSSLAASIQPPGTGGPSNSSSSSSIQSRLNKEGFEKCFSESSGNPPPATAKQASSNRIVFPPVVSVNDPHHSDMIADLSNKKDDHKSNRHHHKDSRPPSREQNDIGKARFTPNFIMPPQLSEHEKRILEQQQQQQKKFAEFQLLQQQQPPLPQSALDHRALMAAYQNPGIKFPREPFSSEQFEREFGQKHAAEGHGGRESDRMLTSSSKADDRTGGGNQFKPSLESMDEASKLFSQSFQKDSQPSSSGAITAANLIHAIITKQINTDTKGPTSLGNYPAPGLGRVKSSPSSTPAPNLKMEDREPSKPSFRQTILNVITDNIQSASSPPPTASSPSVPPTLANARLLNQKSMFENIVAAASVAPPASGSTTAITTSAADNFKLRRALQSNEKSDEPPLHQNKRLAVGENMPENMRQHVIHMALVPPGSTPPASAAPATTVASPSLSGPNIKHLQSHYIEPISPPQPGSRSSPNPNNPPTLPPAAQMGHYQNIWSSLIAPFHNSKQGVPPPPPPVSSAGTVADPHHTQSMPHLPGHHDLFFTNRIAEAMQRATPATSGAPPPSSSTNDNGEDKPSKVTQDNGSRSGTPKKVEEKERTTPNNSSHAEPAPRAPATDRISFPDSPNSPGEMVIDENRPPSSPSPDVVQQQKNSGNTSGGAPSPGPDSKPSKSGVIKLHNNANESQTTEVNSATDAGANPPSVTAKPSTAPVNNEPQYEPLSDDEPN